MKRLFEVNVHHTDGSRDTYKVVAKDDEQAKTKAVNLSIKENGDNYVAVDFCEIERIADVDG